MGFGLGHWLRLGGGPPAPPAGGATVTWSAGASSTDFTLSNGNLTATHTAANEDAIAKGSALKTSGYFEVVIPTFIGSAISHGVGLVSTGSSLPLTGTFIGDSADSIGWRGNGEVYKNSALVATWSSWTSGDVIGIAFKGGKFYGKKNGTTQGGADADAGTGGIDVSATIFNGRPAAACNAQNEVMNLNCGQSAFTGTVPSGITAWG